MLNRFVSSRCVLDTRRLPPLCPSEPPATSPHRSTHAVNETRERERAFHPRRPRFSSCKTPRGVAGECRVPSFRGPERRIKWSECSALLPSLPPSPLRISQIRDKFLPLVRRGDISRGPVRAIRARATPGDGRLSRRSVSLSPRSKCVITRIIPSSNYSEWSARLDRITSRRLAFFFLFFLIISTLISLVCSTTDPFRHWPVVRLSLSGDRIQAVQS